MIKLLRNFFVLSTGLKYRSFLRFKVLALRVGRSSWSLFCSLRSSEWFNTPPFSETLFFSLYFNRERHSYFKEWMNLFDWLGLVLILCIIPLRYTDNRAQWKVASLAFLFNFLRIFKFSCATR